MLTKSILTNELSRGRVHIPAAQRHHSIDDGK